MPAIVRSDDSTSLDNPAPRMRMAANPVPVVQDKAARLAENMDLLANANVNAFLRTIAEAGGGGYDFRYGAVKGKKNDPSRFSDFSTHPGAGRGGRATAAGMYHITVDTWRRHGDQMGLMDFAPKTQDLIAIEMMRAAGVIGKIKAGDIAGAMRPVARKWAALSGSRGQGIQFPAQAFEPYDAFLQNYRSAGGACT